MSRSWTDHEGREQRLLFEWASHLPLPMRELETVEVYGQQHDRERTLSVADVMFWIPNGVGKMSLYVAQKMRAQGLTPGVPDLFLPWPVDGLSGLFLELKAAPPHSAPISPPQQNWIRRLQRLGYAAGVARGHTEAAGMITAYLAGEWFAR